MSSRTKSDSYDVDRFLLAFCLLVLAGTVLYPTLRLLIEAFRQWDFGAITEGLGLAAIRNTFFICIASVVTSCVVGTGFALVLTRYTFPGSRILGGMAYLPFTLPPLIGVLSFYYIIGRDGFIPRFLERYGELENAVLPGFWAILLVHTYSFYVFFYAMVGPALATMDRAQIEAGRTLGASRLRIFFAVTLPQLMPALRGASLLTFMSSGASFSAPHFFGQDFPVLSELIYTERSQFHNGTALTLTVVLACVSLLGVVLFRSRRLVGASASKGTPVPVRSQGGRLVAAVIAWSCIGVLLTPHLVIIWLSFVSYPDWYTELIPTTLTLSNYANLFSNPVVFAPIRNSLWMSGVATLGTVLVAVPAAYLIGRKRGGGAWVNFLVMTPWALPGTVVAMQMIFAFNDPWVPAGTALALLPLAYFVRSVPLLTRMTTAIIEPFDATLIEAARTLGASRAYCFVHIVLPLIAPAVVAGMALVFATSLGEFPASILLYRPGNIPISVQINSEFRSSISVAFAYSVLLMVLVSGTFVASKRLTSRVM